ncbi:hypothetical protein Ancab_032944 [Ancistrocladus abbreviatus]
MVSPKILPNSGSKNPKYKPSKKNSDPSSSSSSLSSLLAEPPPDFFPSKSEFLKLIAVVAIAASVATGCNVLVSLYNRQAKQFCDSNVEYDDPISDSCEPCPRNGQCYNGQLECIQGYRMHGKLCIEDGDINEAANRMSQGVEDHLCQAYAQFLCEGTGMSWVSEDQLRTSLDGIPVMNRFSSDNTTYMYATERAVENLNRLLDTRTNQEGIKEFKCRDNVAEINKTFTCIFRQWIAKHALSLMLACALLLGCMFLLLTVRRRLYLSKRVEQLYHQVYDILEEHALTSKSLNDGEPWLVASRLRDHLLSTGERRDPLLWKKVQELVEEDSRIECYPKLVKGESKVVWEWQVEGSLSSLSQRKKGVVKDLNSSADMSRFPDKDQKPLKMEPKVLAF